MTLSPSEVPQAFGRAVAAFNAGRLAEAETICRQIVAAKRDFADAVHLLAVVQMAMRQFEPALANFERALALQPNNARVLTNHGLALQELGRFNKALSSHDLALKHAPNDAAVFNNRGVTLQSLMRYDDALASFDRALQLQPGHLDARVNRAIVLQAMGRFEEALGSYDAALQQAPNDPELNGNRGVALHALRRFEEALSSYDRALAAAPDYLEALSNRGSTLRELKRFDEALSSYDRALALKPNYVNALSNRGNVLQELRRYDDALASYSRALAIEPDHVDALYNRGTTLKAMRRFDEALKDYRVVLRLRPDHVLAFGDSAECAARMCDMAARAEFAGPLRARVEEGRSIISPFVLLGYSDDNALLLRCAQNYFTSNVPALPAPLWSGSRWRHDKLRVAYVSGDFRHHATAHLISELFERHDRSRFEIVGVSYGVDDGSPARKRLLAAFDDFHDVAQMSDREAAGLMAGLEIDIAVDLNGYAQESRFGIFAHRPAPVQATYLGYPGTMGAACIDYIIADPVVAPFSDQGFYAEKIVQLPDCYQPNDRKRAVAERTPMRADAGLPEQGFVFCCFNNSWKITEPTFDVWMRLLRAVEGSVLWLFRDNPAAERNLRRHAKARGVDPARLVFAPPLPSDEHLARHRLADLFLDTLPYNAHTTASDALWTGLPVLTCKGKAFAGMVAASLLRAVDAPELIAADHGEYETLALKLAREPDALRAIRDKLANNRDRAALFDTDRFRQNIEAAYTGMSEIWQQGQSPRGFAVEAAS